MLIGETLASLFGLKYEEINAALAIQQQVGGYIGQILIQKGSITDTQLVSALSEQLGIPVYDAENHSAYNEDILLSLKDIDPGFLVKNNFIPWSVEEDEKTITLITNDPLNCAITDYLAKGTDYRIRLLLAAEQTIKELSKTFSTSGGADFVSLHYEDSPEKLKEMAFEAPVIKFLNGIVSRAVELRATDVHIEPFERFYRIRLRIDGILHDIHNLENAFCLAVVSRIKLLSGLDIAEKRLPQDGKFSTKIAAVLLDIRVSTIPMIKGEAIVLRLLYRERLNFDIMQLGIEEDHARTILKLISRPYGIIVVTGPTGSGKTTTLYSMLTRLNDKERKIVTVEDPVEYQLDGINQILVKSDIGLTFASALRSVLRHDPDIIMVGEIRDRETAEVAIQSALTGHLVLSTLHTNDAPSSLFRLIEMGIEDYLLNAAVIGVIAQRIVRKNCTFCSEADTVSQALMEEYKIPEIKEAYRDLVENGITFVRGKGCKKCAGTGYRGRLAIFECFNYTDELKEHFIKHHSLEAMKTFLVKNRSFRTLREDGMIKAIKGMTTIEEVLRVI